MTVERIAGIEPATKAWEAFVLPLNYIRQWINDHTLSFHGIKTKQRSLFLP